MIQMTKSSLKTMGRKRLRVGPNILFIYLFILLERLLVLNKTHEGAL